MKKTMVELVSQFFSIIGVDFAVPQTLAELIPYLLTVVVGVVLVSGVFGVIGRLAQLFMDFTRWR
jgi:uncharacterized membrane protein